MSKRRSAALLSPSSRARPAKAVKSSSETCACIGVSRIVPVAGRPRRFVVTEVV